MSQLPSPWAWPPIAFVAMPAGVVGFGTNFAAMGQRASRGMGWGRRIFVIGVTVGLVGAGGELISARGAVPPEGCVLTYSAPAVHIGNGTGGSSCSYVASQVASFAGTGPFRIRVSYRDSSGQVHVRVEVTEPPGQSIQPLTGAATTGSDPNQIGIGDTVDAQVTGPGGFLAIGNPGAPPSSGRHTSPQAPRLFGDTTPVHDPAMVFSDGWYYLFTTGPGIPVRRSHDLVNWQAYGTVFPNATPAWAPQVIHGTQDVWAPDVSFFAGAWHLYYAISTFGSAHSAIGLATNATLDRSNAAYRWSDLGPIIVSEGVTNPSGLPTDYNAIDPNVIIDEAGTPHLEFGSFTTGLQLADVDPSTGLPLRPFRPVPLASNIQEYTAVEGGYMIYRHGWYYLFGSYNSCCQGSRSDYNVRVGRSRSVHGPFVDDMGVPMLTGGARYVLTSSGDMRGPGGEGVISTGGKDYIFFHWYDAANNGTPTLGILPITWTTGGWPVATLNRSTSRPRF